MTTGVQVERCSVVEPEVCCESANPPLARANISRPDLIAERICKCSDLHIRYAPVREATPPLKSAEMNPLAERLAGEV